MEIGAVQVQGMILGPMAGVNCPAFRLHCRKCGAGLVFTQLIDVDELLQKSNPQGYIGSLKGEGPLAVQLIGSKPDTLARATRMIQRYADIIDLNMGCIEPPMLAKQAGSFLMKHPDQIPRAFNAIKENTNKPVTAKIRSGWDEVNAPEVAKMLEDLGASAITVHARTKKQKYQGKADWNVIADVKKRVSMPVIGNGDVHGPSTARKMQEKTACDAVMIARSAIGTPLVFQKDSRLITRLERLNSAKEFIKLYSMQKRQRMPEIIQHMRWYLKGFSRKERERFENARTIKDISDILNAIYLIIQQ